MSTKRRSRPVLTGKKKAKPAKARGKSQVREHWLFVAAIAVAIGMMALIWSRVIY